MLGRAVAGSVSSLIRGGALERPILAPLVPVLAALSRARQLRLGLGLGSAGQHGQRGAAVLGRGLLNRVLGIERESGGHMLRVVPRTGRVHQVQQLLVGVGNGALQLGTDVHGDRRDIVRVVDISRPGRRDQRRFRDQFSGLAPVATRLAQPRRPGRAAVRTRLRLPGLCGGLRSGALELRPGLRLRAGNLLARLFGLGLLTAPHQVLRFQRGLPTQPLLEDRPARSLVGAGQLRVDLSSDPGPHCAAQVDHVAAGRTVTACVEPDPVVTPNVRASPPPHQSAAQQPAQRILHPELAAGLLQPVRQPLGKQLRSRLGPPQQADQLHQFGLRSLLDAPLLPA
ncbi:hypothetical protein [Streptomyces sp. 8N706]|uniref:hypothetical protein n=1 Tax=Streptomyces sp. 8N706 TaxID=3457416 RepID=UPI003FD4CDFB